MPEEVIVVTGIGLDDGCFDEEEKVLLLSDVVVVVVDV